MKKTPKGVPNPTLAALTRDAEMSVAGAVAGAALGSVAGPPGIAAGAAIGAVAGAVSGIALGKGESREAAHERELDDEIGVNGQGLGAPGLKHPPARIGAYSAGSAGSGASGAGDAPASGPLGGPSD